MLRAHAAAARSPHMLRGRRQAARMLQQRATSNAGESYSLNVGRRRSMVAATS